MAATLKDIEALSAYKCHNMPLLVPFIKLHPEAQAPTKAHTSDAGFDFYCIEDIELSHDTPTAMVKTGIAMAIPLGYYGRAAARSGLSMRNNIEVGAGVVDSEYRGEITIKLHMHHTKPEDTPVFLKKGSRVAQIIVELNPPVQLVLVDSLDDTERGAGGFGSSGQ